MKKNVVKEYIVDAVFELLKKNDIQHISVTEIINKAGVCRASFYRNFYEIEDVIRYYLEDLARRCIEGIPLSPSNVYEHTLRSFSVIYEDRDRLTLLNARKLFYLYDDIVYQACSEQMNKLQAGINKYQVYMTTGSSVFVIRAWINSGFKDSPEDIVKLFPAFQYKN